MIFTTRLLILPAALALALPAAAQTGPERGSGFYLRAEAGLNFAPGVGLHTIDDDRASRCDEFINPGYAGLEGCTDPDRTINAVDEWGSDFSDTGGVLLGAAVGRALGTRWRVELEYLFREADYDESAAIISPGGRPYAEIFGRELPRAEERIGDLTNHVLFANVYLDFPGNSRLTPYLGVGAGVAFAAMDYGALWLRSDDPALMETASGLPNEATVRRNLAGTATVARDRLRDELFGFQVVLGVDYRVSESLMVGLRGRWAEFDTLQGGGGYESLRSHTSNLRLDGSEPVSYRTRNPDTGFFGLSLSVTYRL